ncbi:fosfomycin resistance glutathione transferase [Providencia vermicola]|uniref:Fosfomycin resistance glutathione transferase n=2 Tax=Providencia TaxID=586 RepID=A0AAI9MY84_PROST|nr:MULTISPECIES: fosfomycin resistance glutathione transferase [Providencia]ELR5035315.1 fosfomycin resistance glutathione transferase [Providencia stuartii]ELR5037929.1 fosfomycin resistance glutathione transferase [Providencia stuartii]ELR5120258.1 fosfomycin resistance glutathione transferase [Providencia stuartii]ELR5123357.1 fosfomycin resistance glutathione transferase [Providencia stuartii]ELR5143455.1 fosfomycin resistance glutathione transferase [Providencia stuartii]
MLTGINHLTLAVTDIKNSLFFYHSILGMKLHARWKNGAYLTCGELWVCLSVDPTRKAQRPEKTDYTHYAFTVSSKDFSTVVEKLQRADVTVWKDNRSEGDSFYFLDPDGHKLEIHVGSLIERLAHCQKAPYENMVFYD